MSESLNLLPNDAIGAAEKMAAAHNASVELTMLEDAHAEHQQREAAEQDRITAHVNRAVDVTDETSMQEYKNVHDHLAAMESALQDNLAFMNEKTIRNGRVISSKLTPEELIAQGTAASPETYSDVAKQVDKKAAAAAQRVATIEAIVSKMAADDEASNKLDTSKVDQASLDLLKTLTGQNNTSQTNESKSPEVSPKEENAATTPQSTPETPSQINDEPKAPKPEPKVEQPKATAAEVSEPQEPGQKPKPAATPEAATPEPAATGPEPNTPDAEEAAATEEPATAEESETEEPELDLESLEMLGEITEELAHHSEITHAMLRDILGLTNEQANKIVAYLGREGILEPAGSNNEKYTVNRDKLEELQNYIDENADAPDAEDDTPDETPTSKIPVASTGAEPKPTQDEEELSDLEAYKAEIDTALDGEEFKKLSDKKKEALRKELLDEFKEHPFVLDEEGEYDESSADYLKKVKKTVLQPKLFEGARGKFNSLRKGENVDAKLARMDAEAKERELNGNPDDDDQEKPESRQAAKRHKIAKWLAKYAIRNDLAAAQGRIETTEADDADDAKKDDPDSSKPAERKRPKTPSRARGMGKRMLNYLGLGPEGLDEIGISELMDQKPSKELARSSR